MKMTKREIGIIEDLCRENASRLGVDFGQLHKRVIDVRGITIYGIIVEDRGHHSSACFFKVLHSNPSSFIGETLYVEKNTLERFPNADTLRDSIHTNPIEFFDASMDIVSHTFTANIVDDSIGSRLCLNGSIQMGEKVDSQSMSIPMGAVDNLIKTIIVLKNAKECGIGIDKPYIITEGLGKGCIGTFDGNLFAVHGSPIAAHEYPFVVLYSPHKDIVEGSTLAVQEYEEWVPSADALKKGDNKC